MKSSGLMEETQMDPVDVGDDAQDENLLQGEAELVPRIGDEFQVELPLIYKSEAAFPPDQNFVVGLPLLLTCIKDQNSENDDCCFVPGPSDVHWNASEKESFLLGLYIFEKDFVGIKKFLETKDTGALLSYYYGKFYGSQQYRRWCDCRKVKGKKGVYGRHLFSGLRQQELLSRMLPKVSEEHQNAVVEVSKAFSDEKMSLSDYVSFLKNKVGVKILVEAVGIGTGKRDLTTMALESTRSSQGMPIRPGIPIGKACSALTATEIVKFLSGDYRLSKARSSDLFWEAVWPRLLARGWRSEQPKDQAHYKNSLVFIAPDVKKFTRRKLVKGDHYFDSVTDVLSKVAHEPGLIRLENEGDEGCVVKKEEFEDSEQPARQKLCFLQPKTPKRSVTVMKFTVVDTMSDGKIRDLRALPFDVSVSRLFDEISAESDTVDRNTNGKTRYHDSCSATSKKRKNPCKKHPSEKLSKSRKLKHDTPGPTTKRSRILSACNHDEKTATAVFPPLDDEPMDKLSSAGSCRGSPMDSIENLVFAKEQEDTSIPAPNPGIQGKRNRALTSRAMEALVNGYLTVNRRRKADEKTSSSNVASKWPQRARVRKTATPDESMNSCAGSQVGEAANCCSNGSAQVQVGEETTEREACEDFHVDNGDASAAKWERDKSL